MIFKIWSNNFYIILEIKGSRHARAPYLEIVKKILL